VYGVVARTNHAAPDMPPRGVASRLVTAHGVVVLAEYRSKARGDLA